MSGFSPWPGAPVITGLKIKIPPKETAELDHVYDLLFLPEYLFAGWAGRVGHYDYGDNKATDQDGYFYIYPYRFTADWCDWRVTCSPSCARIFANRFIELNI